MVSAPRVDLDIVGSGEEGIGGANMSVNCESIAKGGKAYQRERNCKTGGQWLSTFTLIPKADHSDQNKPLLLLIENITLMSDKGSA